MLTSRKYKADVISANPKLTCKQLAIKLGCSVTTVWSVAEEYKLPYAPVHRNGGRKASPRKNDVTKKGYFDVEAYAKASAY